MKMSQFEKQLYAHAESVIDNMAAPFGEDEGFAGIISKALYEQERRSNTVRSKRIIAIIAVAAALACVGTAFAATGLRSWQSYPETKYETVPSVEVVTEDIGYEPVVIEEFENGFVYATGYAVDNDITDESGAVEDSFKSASFTYERDGEEVWFSQEKYDWNTEPRGELVATVDGIDIYSTGYTNKIVPADYQMTDEDKADEESGKLVFSWGSDEVMVMEVKSVQWRIEGINYMLMQMGGTVTVDELCTMAKEIISR